jgi:hypothetical protein
MDERRGGSHELDLMAVWQLPVIVEKDETQNNL